MNKYISFQNITRLSEKQNPFGSEHTISRGCLLVTPGAHKPCMTRMVLFSLDDYL